MAFSIEYSGHKGAPDSFCNYNHSIINNSPNFNKREINKLSPWHFVLHTIIIFLS